MSEGDLHGLTLCAGIGGRENMMITILDTTDRTLVDWLYAITKEKVPPNHPVGLRLVGGDIEYEWTWPRARLAKVLKALSDIERIRVTATLFNEPINEFGHRHSRERTWHCEREGEQLHDVVIRLDTKTGSYALASVGDHRYSPAGREVKRHGTRHLFNVPAEDIPMTSFLVSA